MRQVRPAPSLADEDADFGFVLPRRGCYEVALQEDGQADPAARAESPEVHARQRDAPSGAFGAGRNLAKRPRLLAVDHRTGPCSTPFQIA